MMRMTLAAVMTVAAMVAGTAAAAAQTATGAAARDLEREAIGLIEGIADTAREVRFHTSSLETLTNSSTVSRWSHYEHLDIVRGLVNTRIRPALQRLTEIHALLPEWKQEGVDQLLAAARDLAGDTSSAIYAKATNPTRPVVLNTEYRELVARMQSHARTLTERADATARYALAQRKAIEVGLPVGR